MLFRLRNVTCNPQQLICWMLPLATHCHIHFHFHPFHFMLFLSSKMWLLSNLQQIYVHTSTCNHVVPFLHNENGVIVCFDNQWTISVSYTKLSLVVVRMKSSNDIFSSTRLQQDMTVGTQFYPKCIASHTQGTELRPVSFPGLPRLQFLIACSMQKQQAIKNWGQGRPGNEASYGQSTNYTRMTRK